MKKRPQVSLIIALDDHSNPEKTLPTLVNQAAADVMEVNIVNGINEGQWKRELDRMPKKDIDKARIRYFEIGKCGRAKAWNYGAKMSNSDILIFMADDFMPVPNFTKEHLRQHKVNQAENIVVIGPTFFPKDENLSPFMRWLEDSGSLVGISFKKPETIPPNYFWGANVSLKKKFFDKAGGFDEDFPYHAWEDYELGLRLNNLGMQTIYTPKALTYHDHIITIPERLESMEQAGESAVIFESKYPGPWPWHEKTKTPLLAYLIFTQWRILKYKLLKNKKDREKFYENKIDIAFVRGYKRKQKEQLTVRN